MKKTTFYLLLTALAFAGVSLNATADVNEICGNDTIVLRVSNYQYGTIEWERSTDMESWVSVPNARDTVYRFFPEESMYYRAVVKFPDCPPEYSEISYVQMAPVANAGFDRVVPGNEVRLFANQPEGANGQWSIVSGSNGSLSNSSAHNALLTGTDSLYTLVWTLSNACGTSRDTLRVRFRENVFIDNYVVVDQTDTLRSSFEELAAGMYIIEFSEPVPDISNGTVLIGMQGEGFLRKVESFTSDENVYSMQTTQANLEDITVQGAFNLAPEVVFDKQQGTIKSGHYERLERLPTRQELKTDPRFKNGNFYYEPAQQQPMYLHPGVKLNTREKDENEPLIDLDIHSSWSYGPVELNLSGNYSFYPNLVIDLDYGYFGLYYFKLGMSNATVEKNIDLSLTASGEYTLAEREFTLFSGSRHIVFLIGGVPVTVQFAFSVDGEFNASLEAEATAGVNFNETDTYNSYIVYSQSANWNNWHRATNSVSLTPHFTSSGKFEQDFSIGPRVSISLYGQFGPYIDLKLNQDFNACFKDANWEAGINLGAELTLGALGQIVGRELFDYSKAWPRTFYRYKYPYRINYHSGNNQTYLEGEELPHPVRVRVESNRGGLSLPFARVRFSPLCGGSVQDSIVSTDLLGYAETYWSPADTLESRLEVFVLGCEEENINHSPLLFIAQADTLCNHSSLSVTVLESDTLISPLAQMGEPPYMYSTDGGETFLPEIPEIVPIPHEEYTFTVRDEDECLASVSYTAPDPCENTTLALTAVVTDNELTVEATGGEPPYLYSVNEGAFNETVPFFITTPGEEYTISVKDSKECVATVNHAAPHSCDYLVLHLDVDNDNSTITAFASGGVAPYRYSLGDTTNFSANNEFTHLAGTYKVYVKDLEGCIAFQYAEVEIAEVVIGDQIWMKRNLAVDVGNNMWPTQRYYYDENCEWIGSTWVNGRPIEHADTEYGRLYDWESAMNACPSGWRLPSRKDWEDLIDYLGGSEVAAGKLKSTLTGNFCTEQEESTINQNPSGHPFWYEPNIDATNESGFSALPAGGPSISGHKYIGEKAVFWSSTWASGVVTSRYTQVLLYNYSFTYGTGTPVTHEASVRCIKGEIYDLDLYPSIANYEEYCGYASANPPGDLGKYFEGDEVVITAHPSEGCSFVNWTGDINHIDDPNSASTTLTMPAANVELTAVFEPTGD